MNRLFSIIVINYSLTAGIRSTFPNNLEIQHQ